MAFTGGENENALATLEAESYAIDVAGPENADCRLTVAGYLGDTEITSETADIVFDEDGCAEFDAVRGRKKTTWTFPTLIHHVRLRCKILKYLDMSSLLRLVDRAPQCPKRTNLFSSAP